ncbi:TIGR02281 family clan AA aspartic protease [Mesorhizobium sp. BAC0120]|uniref:TIGR02281 family clan AA aspartic protease n=1 Tax=Mesorhizobium sp. BAC0120 TaxID=3090670 RepID=UPI00298C69C7|nr:TIGR02281 family clan AA aspartic protease [Mesorhizobium sp. BAC0120]MDW6024162.1 TIGR02281 family clan AA aspartic protease [Mesorhizobium sp. BAC0120]
MKARAISLFAVVLFVLFSGAAGYAYDHADLQRASEELGISLPDEVLEGPGVAKQLGALSRERCDQQAAYSLSKELEEESYRREAAESLVRFSDNCGGYANGIRRAINLLLDVSDYSRSIELANRLIEMEPNGDNGYFLRAVAYEGDNQCEKAIADYSSAIELFGNKDSISSVGYESMSRCYEQLGQYCDAMVPIKSWVALDPGSHENDQTRSILRRLSSKGGCAEETTGKKEETIRRKAGNVIKVDASINGVKGTFVIDTGATFVTVKKRSAEKAGLKAAGQRIKLNTANGTVDGYLTRADSVKLRSLEAERVQLVVQVDDDANYGDGTDGLLGMSFLSRFDVAMDSKALRIRPKKSK